MPESLERYERRPFSGHGSGWIQIDDRLAGSGLPVREAAEVCIRCPSTTPLTITAATSTVNGKKIVDRPVVAAIPIAAAVETATTSQNAAR